MVLIVVGRDGSMLGRDGSRLGRDGSSRERW